MRILLLIATILLRFLAFSTHIVGGEITASRSDNVSLTYDITISVYSDVDSSIETGFGTIDFGDGEQVEGLFQVTRELINQNLQRNIITIKHTYKGPSAAGYIISYEEIGRNEGIANINNGSSGQIRFYTETKLVIDPFLGSNNTPILTNPPAESGRVGKIYNANPGAYDPDGDLLTYRIVSVKRMKDVEVREFKLPNDPSFYSNYQGGNEAGNGLPVFQIDKFSGWITWDSPGDFSFNPDCDRGSTYNIAYAVDEWRNLRGTWYRLGYVVRDYIINVNSCEDSNSPMFSFLSDTCVAAGSSMDISLSASLPGAHSLRYAAFGEPFQLTNSAVYRDDSIALNIQWTPHCSEVRSEPYYFYLNASDYRWRSNTIPANESWKVYVKAPKVEGIKVVGEGTGSIRVSWTPYSCPNADSIEVWRKEGDSVIDLCDLNNPADLGYALMGKVPIDQLTFLDQNIQDGKSSIHYQYYLRAVFDNNNMNIEEFVGLLTGSSDSWQSRIKIYPNPNHGEFKIEGTKPGWRLMLYDLSGSRLINEMIDPSGLVQLENYIPKGHYMLLIINQEGQLIENHRLFLQ